MELAKHYLQNITGVEIFPIISIIIFFLFFIAVTWYVMSIDKKEIEEMASLALDNDEEEDVKSIIDNKS